MSSDNDENPHENEDDNQDKTFFGFNLFDEAKENFTKIQIQFEDKKLQQILSNSTKYKRETLAEAVIKLKKICQSFLEVIESRTNIAESQDRVSVSDNQLPPRAAAGRSGSSESQPGQSPVLQPVRESQQEQEETPPPTLPSHTHKSHNFSHLHPQPPLCRKFKFGNCPHGMSGKSLQNGQKCKFNHPRLCHKFMKNGNFGRYGCKNTSCEYFHPIICQNSFKRRKCLIKNCSKWHLKGTTRIEKSFQKIPSYNIHQQQKGSAAHVAGTFFPRNQGQDNPKPNRSTDNVRGNFLDPTP